MVLETVKLAGLTAPYFCTYIQHPPEHHSVPFFFVLNFLSPVWFSARAVHQGGVVGVHQEDRRVAPWVESFWSNPILLLCFLHQRLDKIFLVRMTDGDGLCLRFSHWSNLLEESSVDEAVAKTLGGWTGVALTHCTVQTLLLAKP